MRDIPKFPPKAERVLTALLHHGAVRAAAKEAGVSEATVFRYLQDPEFQSRYRDARRQLVETAIAQLQSDCTIAVRVLREVAEDREAPASSRVAAARTIIEQSVSAIELLDLQDRVEMLEKMLPVTAGKNYGTKRAY
ncbi:MAG: LacI family DNA-binding transcriptional regulator [Acidobacteriota bacterium]|nr:LacI family DNA-binding transcriptional regulator [Acidobacteriota bacterium]